jgi:hypothetical protein
MHIVDLFNYLSGGVVKAGTAASSGWLHTSLPARHFTKIGSSASTALMRYEGHSSASKQAAEVGSTVIPSPALHRVFSSTSLPDRRSHTQDYC